MLPRQSSCSSISPEQAAYNALTVFFYGTPAAAAPLVGETWSFSATSGSAPLNYLQIYWEDVQYATNTMNTPSIVQYYLDPAGWSLACTVTGCPKTLLDAASAQLTLIAEPDPSLSPRSDVPLILAENVTLQLQREHTGIDAQHQFHLAVNTHDERQQSDGDGVREPESDTF
jgi:hypothetical protein